MSAAALDTASVGHISSARRVGDAAGCRVYHPGHDWAVCESVHTGVSKPHFRSARREGGRGVPVVTLLARIYLDPVGAVIAAGLSLAHHQTLDAVLLLQRGQLLDDAGSQMLLDVLGQCLVVGPGHDKVVA